MALPSSPSFPPRFKSRFPAKQNNDEHRINERIRVPQVRLIDEKGTQVGIVDTREALRMAQDRGLDLMEVTGSANPPVCKICDYGKFKYEKKKKEHQAKKKQVVIKVKEVQLRPTTDTHDLDVKSRQARGFLEDGDKVKFTMLFRGRQITHTEIGMKVIKELVKALSDVGIVEMEAKLEGKKAIMIMAPNAVKKPSGAASKAAPAAKPAAGKPAPAKPNGNAD
ncbi:MAG: translation initiation factor IF-3 [Bdellovibrionales bacterium]|nr:translation initiation factor IF-3 [Bdellovibrionales bacterium]